MSARLPSKRRSSKWSDMPRVTAQEATAALRILARLGRFYVDAVTQEDLRTLIDGSLTKGGKRLSPRAIKFRLSCLSDLGVKARVGPI